MAEITFWISHNLCASIFPKLNCYQDCICFIEIFVWKEERFLFKARVCVQWSEPPGLTDGFQCLLNTSYPSSGLQDALVADILTFSFTIYGNSNFPWYYINQGSV